MQLATLQLQTGLCCKYCLILDAFPLPRQKEREKQLGGSGQEEWWKRCWNKQDLSSELPYPLRTAHKTCSDWDWASYSSSGILVPHTNTHVGYKCTQFIVKCLTCMVYYLDHKQMRRSYLNNTQQLQRVTIPIKIISFEEQMRIEAGNDAVYCSDPQINSACSCVKWRLDPWLIVSFALSKHKLHICNLYKHIPTAIYRITHCNCSLRNKSGAFKMLPDTT